MEQYAFNERPKIGELMLIVMEKSTHEENLSQSLQTNKKIFKVAVSFLTAYNGIFNVTNKNYEFSFALSNNNDDFTQITTPLGAYQNENLNNGIKSLFIEEGYFSEAIYPFRVKPNFSILDSIVEISSNINGSEITFTTNGSIRN